MITRIYSDLPSFKTLKFHKGLNILLAEKSPGATDKQTRNGAGKTSLVTIIHFLFGASCDTDSIFRKPELVNATFGIEFDVRGQHLQVERSGKKPSRVVIRCSEVSPLHEAEIERKTGQLVISNSNWRVALGTLIFGVPPNQAPKYCPTFRSLIGYFIRRQNSGGFVLPTKQNMKQMPWDEHVAVSYLLGLDWTISSQWQVVRDAERMLKELRKAAQGGAFGAVIRTTADLRTALTIAGERAQRLESDLKRFEVLPEYHQFETEASEITRHLSDLSDDNTIDKQIVSDLEQAISAEVPPTLSHLDSLFGEAGIVLPDLVKRRVAEVREFHNSVIANRRSYLQGQLQEARERLAGRAEIMKRHDERRSQLMRMLQAKGALEHFTLLQKELSSIRSEVEHLQHQFEIAQQLEGKETEYKIERNRLLLRLRQDFQEQKVALDRAILAFEEVSNALYESAGSLTISATTNGPEFSVAIHGKESSGINKMQVYCLDMMLMKLCHRATIGPQLLVHDSHLFDGVDERQVSTALSFGASLADELDFQYIVTMNSDVVPRTWPSQFSFNDFVLPVQLTDAREDGGLFGIRFD